MRAYSRKRAIAQSAGSSPVSHERLLSEIFGIDIAAFPAQLSTINLAVRHLSDEANYPRVARPVSSTPRQASRCMTYR